MSLPDAEPKTAAKPSLWSALTVYGERRALIMLALGFASGLPNLLIFDTLSAWLRESGLSLQVISIFSLATLAYSMKLLWAPLVDRTKIPWLTDRLGHRRSWMLVSQVAIMIGLWLVAGGDPVRNLGAMAMLAVLVAFSGATQDIVIDAWRIEAAGENRQGALAAAYQWGYRIAIIVAGAVPLILAQQYSWNVSYLVMAALMLVGVAGVLGAPREAQHIIRAINLDGVPARPGLELPEWLARLSLVVIGAIILGSGLAGSADLLAGALTRLGQTEAAESLATAWTTRPWNAFLQVGAVLAGGGLIVLAAFPLPGLRTRPGVYLSAALFDPFIDFFDRYRGSAALILALICLYRLADFVLNIMTPFYLDLGFTLTEIAEVRKVFGVAMSMLGVFLGGLAVARLGLIRAMLIGAFAGPLSNLIFAWLAIKGAWLPALFVAIGVDNVAGGFAGTCLIAYMSSLTGYGFTATQYAVFSSFYSLPGKLLASQSGRIVEGSAAAAEAGGLLGPLKALFVGLPPDAYAAAVEKSGVSAAALGAGYVLFFVYSALIGVVGIILAFMVAARQPRPPEGAEPEAAQSAGETTPAEARRPARPWSPAPLQAPACPRGPAQAQAWRSRCWFPGRSPGPPAGRGAGCRPPGRSSPASPARPRRSSPPGGPMR
ncbi:MFS transporter [Phenylobacterium sp.]|uniref:AmpG family muropeptide MFS transporter n=1 Tax=Phenylobacterium sp. TaxID=1871053 RepID=UPI0035203206